MSKFIDLFAGTGAFSYVFEKNGFECVFANDMIPSSKNIYELNNTNVFCLQDLNTVNVEDIPHHDILCGGFPCFVKGTKVLTNRGYLSIQDVELSDLLLTHTGQFQKIINLQRKIYSGLLYDINIKYHGDIIQCTEEHPFYIREKIKTWNNNIRRYTFSFKEPEWKLAKNLTSNDYYGMVINQKSIIPEFTFTKKVNQHKYKTQTIKLDKKDYWFMMGYFVGDGWIEDTTKKDNRCMYKIRFAINNHDEIEVVNKINKVMPITYKKCDSGQSKKFGCANLMWHNILKMFGKYAHGKKIPEWVQDAPKEFIQEFINGYLKADGYTTQQLEEIITVSENLAYGLQRLYLKLGYIASIIKTIRPKTCVIQDRLVNQRDTYRIIRYKNIKRKQCAFIEDNYVWFPIHKIIKHDVLDEQVFNFEVENDNSYIVYNTLVHNCQPFSISGKQLGFNDERANVFWKIVEILKHHKPSIIILENVKNLQSHDKGNTFKIIMENLTNIGYHMKTQILDTCKITKIPQHRERIYMVGFLDEEKAKKFNFDFPLVENYQIKDLLENEIPNKYYYHSGLKVYNTVIENVTKHINENTLYQYRRYYVRENKSNCCPTLTANMGGGGHNVPLLKDDRGVRKLTPRECFNLQGFPSDYQLPPLSDSALYKLAGNAVSVPIIELIVEKLKQI